MELTIKQFAAMGGKARWSKISKKERSRQMSELARKRVNKPRTPEALKMSKKYKALAEWREKHPDRRDAHRKVFVAVRNGTLVKESCFCGDTKVEAHHDDYSHPLEVVWLCKKHHGKADQARRSLSTPLPQVELARYEQVR